LSEEVAPVSDATWYYQNGTDWTGPFSEAQLAALLAARVVTRETLVRAGDVDATRQLSEAFDFAREAPPPLPADARADEATPAARAHVAPPALSESGAWTDTSPHPWRRYLARMFDILIFSSLSWLLIGFAFGAIDPDSAQAFFAMFEGRWGALVGALIGVPLACTWSAIFIGLTGGTPGKWLFGVRIVDADGNPPGLFVAFEREAMVWIVGMGLALPVVSFVTLIAAYMHLDKDKITGWDERLKLSARHRPEGSLQLALGTAAVVLWVILTVALRFMS
jgi:uncharacterized RDD family membrane protein YckC